MCRRLLQLLALSALGCASPPLHASLESAEGLGKGSRVYAAGVAVGEVKSVGVDGVTADVAFTLRPGTTLSLRADACAMSLPDEQGALLLLFPGKELERLDRRPVPGCEPHEQRLTALKQLASSGSGALSQAINRFLNTLAQAEPPRGKACGALLVSRLRTEPVGAVPVVLPAGGRRLWLAVENRGESPVSLEAATFLDARGGVAPRAHVPEDGALFSPVSIAPHTRREVSAIFAGSNASEVSAVEVKATSVDAGCSVRWRL